MIDFHTLGWIKGLQSTRLDTLRVGFLAAVAFAAGNGDMASVPVATNGAGYQTIPTVAFANVGSGSGQTATAVMGVYGIPTIAAAGTGGTTGTQTVTGTTGTGTPFQASVTIAGGVITTVLSVTVHGAYTAMPSSLTAEPVTGGGLTGAQLNLSAAMGVASITLAGSSNHGYPASGITPSLTGGTPGTAATLSAPTVTSVAGQGTTLAISSTLIPGLSLPSTYSAQATPDGDVVCNITGKTNAGFSLNVNPRLASQTLAAGHVDLWIAA